MKWGLCLEMLLLVWLLVWLLMFFEGLREV